MKAQSGQALSRKMKETDLQEDRARLPINQTGKLFFSLYPSEGFSLIFIIAFPQNFKFPFLRASGLKHPCDLKFSFRRFVLAEIGGNPPN